MSEQPSGAADPSTAPKAETSVTNRDLEALGLGAPKPPEDQDFGSAEVKIDQKIRYKIKDPYRSLSFGSPEQIEKTIIAYATSTTREIAARVEMDPLIAQKTSIGKHVHAAFADKGAGGEMEDAKPSIKPISSWAACAIFIAVFGIAIPLVLPWGEFMTVASMITVICYALAGKVKIDTGHVGVLTLVGNRMESFNILGWKFANALADEGTHWTLPFVTDLIAVDVREKIAEIKDLKVIAGNAENAGKIIPEDVAKSVDDTFGPELGVDILGVITEEVVPTDTGIIEARAEIIKMREQRRIEEEKSKAEAVDSKERTERTLDMIQRLGITDDGKKIQVLNMVAAQEDELERNETIITVNGAGEADRLIGSLIAAAQSIGAIKNQNQGGGKKKDRRNRDRNRGGTQHGQRQN